MKYEVKKLLVLIWLLAVGTVRSDLPVHCLAKDIRGEWVLLRSTDLRDSQQECGHQHPDKNTDHIFDKVTSYLGSKTVTVYLELPNIVMIDETKVGHWSMVYDEGFEIFLDSGENYFAFSKYTLKKNI